MKVNDLIGLLTGDPMGQQNKNMTAVYSNPFQAQMALAERAANKTGAAGRAITDEVRSMFSDYLPERKLTREEQFENAIGGIEDLGSEEGFNQFLDAYAMVDPISVFDIRNRLEQQQIQAERNNALFGIQMAQENDKLMERQQKRTDAETKETNMESLKSNILSMIPEGLKTNALTDMINNPEFTVAQSLNVAQNAINNANPDNPVSNINTLYDGEGKLRIIGIQGGRTVEIKGGDSNNYPVINDISNFSKTAKKEPKENIEILPDLSQQERTDYVKIFKDNNFSTDQKLYESFYGKSDAKFIKPKISFTSPEVLNLFKQAEKLRQKLGGDMSLSDSLILAVNNAKSNISKTPEENKSTKPNLDRTVPEEQ